VPEPLVLDDDFSRAICLSLVDDFMPQIGIVELVAHDVEQIVILALDNPAPHYAGV
jgi:hypothetical protein